MVINKYKMVGNVLLTFGLWGNNVYGLADVDGAGVPAAFQLLSRELRASDSTSGRDDASDGASGVPQLLSNGERLRASDGASNVDDTKVSDGTSDVSQPQSEEEELWVRRTNGRAFDTDDSDGASDVSQQESKEEKLQEAVTYAGLTARGLALDLAEVAKLIQSGADPTCRDEEGQTLLHLAGCAEVLALLLSLLDMDIDARDDRGNTALHEHADAYLQCIWDTSCSGKEEIEVLLECGANPCLENEDGKTPLQLLKEWVVEEKSVPPEKRNPNSKDALDRVRKTIQMLRDAEENWIAAHP